MTPRTQAKIDHMKLFGEEMIPIPCEPGQVKKALEDRKARDMKLKGYVEDKDKNPLYKKRTDVTAAAKKVKTTKEIHTVAADFCH